MTHRLIDRIAAPGDAATAEVARRLEAGEPWTAVAPSPLDLVAAIARIGLGAEGAEGPALTQGEPRHPALARAINDAALAEVFPQSRRPARLSLAAGLLQVLDHWDASHAAAQEADDLGEHVHAPYWHKVAHRREPDPGNAHYWARRIRRHPILPALAPLARPLIEGHPDLATRLLPSNTWDPAAFIDLCDRARPGSPEAAVLRRLQRLEMVTLLEATMGDLIGLTASR